MNRREFITLLGGAAAAWPLAARGAAGRARAPHRRAHEPGRRRCGRASSHTRVPARAAGAGLDCRPQRADRLSLGCQWCRRRACAKYAAELVALAPDVILAATGRDRSGAAADDAGTIPIVFAHGYRSGQRRLRRQPGAAGRQCHRVHRIEYSISAKWLELLKEIAPGVTRVAVLREPTTRRRSARLRCMQTAAPSFGVELSRSTCATPARSSARSTTSHAPPTAV